MDMYYWPKIHYLLDVFRNVFQFTFMSFLLLFSFFVLFKNVVFSFFHKFFGVWSIFFLQSTFFFSLKNKAICHVILKERKLVLLHYYYYITLVLSVASACTSFAVSTESLVCALIISLVSLQKKNVIRKKHQKNAMKNVI